jgi:alpha-N-acetylglucosamine transferase
MAVVVSSLLSSLLTRLVDWSSVIPSYEAVHQFSHMRQLNPIPHSPKFAIVTLVTQADYLLPAYALGMSLRLQRTVWPTVAVLSRALASDADVIQNLTIAGFNFVHVVDTIENPARYLPPERVAALRAAGKSMQAHKMDVFTKLRVFEMTQFDRVLLLDADTVIVGAIDHLLYEEKPYAVVPSLVHAGECTNRSELDRRFLFEYKDRVYCQSHALTPYHGIADLAISNTGVVVLAPSLDVFDGLMTLLARELDFDDTCIGTHGCNDQRLLNVYYHSRQNQVARLGLIYNVDCDQLHDEAFINGSFEPAIIHYRGHKKPWALDDESTRCDWRERDRCGAFVSTYEKFERLWLRTVLKLDKAQVDALYDPGRCRRTPRMTEEEKLHMKRDKAKCRQKCVIDDSTRRGGDKCDKFCKWFPTMTVRNGSSALPSSLDDDGDDDDDDDETNEDE